MVSVFFPLRCVHCGRTGAWLCPECASALTPVTRVSCGRCGRPARQAAGASRPAAPATRPTAPSSSLAPPPDGYSCPECRGRDIHFKSARAAFAFEGPARSLVHRLKYSGHRRLADFMAELACNQAGLTHPAKAVTLTYVPLHSSKLVSRGYNQAGLFARALSRRLNLPLQDLLCKQHLTQPQNQLGYEERRLNPQGSVALRPDAGRRLRPERAGRVRSGRGREPAPPARIVLVDDVYTTGSTVSECARVLSGGLGAEVDVWTFARTVKTGLR
ncbi:MAG: double zinc ribbon domain-containing protein [Thermoleophilia bacterium]